MSEKSELRAEVRAARRAQPAADRTTADQALVTHVTTLTADLAAGVAGPGLTVAGYAPMPGEPGGPLLLEALAGAVGRVLLPILLADADLDWAAYAGPASLTTARFAQPTGARLGPAAIATVDLVLVPAVAVDRHGGRLGRGGGSYDRALARLDPGVPVYALIYDGELHDRVPTEPHDRPVTGVISPSGVIHLPS